MKKALVVASAICVLVCAFGMGAAVKGGEVAAARSAALTAGAVALVLGIGFGVFAERTRRDNADVVYTKKALPRLRRSRRVNFGRALRWGAVIAISIYMGILARKGS